MMRIEKHDSIIENQFVRNGSYVMYKKYTCAKDFTVDKTTLKAIGDQIYLKQLMYIANQDSCFRK